MKARYRTLNYLRIRFPLFHIYNSGKMFVNSDEKEMPCLSNDLDSKKVISFYVLLKLINLLNVLKIILSPTQMGTSKLDFFLHIFCKTTCLWFGVYHLVMEAVTGCARSITWTYPYPRAGISTKQEVAVKMCRHLSPEISALVERNWVREGPSCLFSGQRSATWTKRKMGSVPVSIIRLWKSIHEE